MAPYREISMHGGCRKSLAPIGKYNPPLIHKLGYQMRWFSKWDSGNIRNADGRFRFQYQTHWLCLKDRCRNNEFIWQLFVSCVTFNIITRYWSYSLNKDLYAYLVANISRWIWVNQDDSFDTGRGRYLICMFSVRHASHFSYGIQYIVICEIYSQIIHKRNRKNCICLKHCNM